MPKHSARQFTTARLVLGLGAAILVVLVGWIAVRAGGPAVADDAPVIVQPSAPAPAETDLQAVESPLPEATSVTPSPSSASPSPSRSSSASASPSASPSPSASRKPKKSKSPQPSVSVPAPTSPSPSRTSATPAGLQATYATGSSWRDGFTAGVRVVNKGSVAQSFTVTITYASGTDLEIRGDWNAEVSAGGNQVTIRGGSLAPGSSITAGFQAAKDDDDSSRATGCTVVGGTCSVG
ncbi:cellulose binding domain-containing protein [Actinoplanes sp. NPDC024001]|uniref:cellulose binding domain-containing protein n=1 Tax=Actinoplanes sp. NPDC024001 TaxID=3154598 RepID=UPI0033EC0C9A